MKNAQDVKKQIQEIENTYSKQDEFKKHTLNKAKKLLGLLKSVMFYLESVPPPL